MSHDVESDTLPTPGEFVEWAKQWYAQGGIKEDSDLSRARNNHMEELLTHGIKWNVGSDIDDEARRLLKALPTWLVKRRGDYQDSSTADQKLHLIAVESITPETLSEYASSRFNGLNNLAEKLREDIFGDDRRLDPIAIYKRRDQWMRYKAVAERAAELQGGF